MDVAVRYDDLTGIRQIEVACWPGKVLTVWHDGTQFPGVLVQAPMRFRLEQLGLIWWGFATPTRGKLLVVPHFMPGLPTDFLNDTTPPSGPMLVHVPMKHKKRRGGIAVIDQKDL